MPGYLKHLFLLLLTLAANPVTPASGSDIASTLTSGTPESLPHYEILFIGNSHSSLNDLPGLVATLIKAGNPGATADADTAPGWAFLADRLNDGVTLQALDSRSWTHVVLQAQKYSTTGRYTYPTTAAEIWIRRIKERNALPILFPEWPRFGNTEEGPRIHQLHLDISSRESACVAPIGLAWEEAIEQYPQLRLHAVDGNHSSLTGALLTAYVLYQVITWQDASTLPYVPEIPLAAQVQQDLRGVASSVVIQNSAACPAPPTPPETELDDFEHAAVPTLNRWGTITLALLLAASVSLWPRAKP